MNFIDFTKLVEEKISDFPNYEITNKGKTYIWIGKKNGKIGNWNCHYEIIQEIENKQFCNAEIHFENNEKKQFKKVASEQYPLVPNYENTRVRINIKPIEISKENIKTCFDNFNEAENTVGEKLEKIQNDIYHQNILKLINTYKVLLKDNPKEAIEDEKYKWILIEKCNRKSTEEIISATIKSNVVYKNATMMFSDLLKKDRERTCSIVDELFDENITFEERFNSFKNNLKSFCSERDTLCENDERTAVSLLTCKYPEKYIFFKPTTYESLCNYLLLSKKPAVKRVEHYLQIIHDICNVIESETDLLSLLTPYLKDFRTNIALISQTILWVTPLLKKSGDDEEENMDNKLTKECKNLLLNTHNLILHGAPGTGKTHLAKEIAKEMGCTDDGIGFVQFHPSYDYTDFVEGLRPVHNAKNEVVFERKNGVFKSFCKNALKNLIDSKKEKDKVSEELSNKERINAFLAKSVADQREFNIKIGTSFYITNFDENHILTSYKKDDKLIEVEPIRYSDILTLLNADKEIQRMDVKIYVNRKVERQADSYSSVIVNAIRNEKSEINTKETIDNSEKSYVFIIDEINRGELSKIFGELFYNIDPGYRGENGKIATQYQNLVEEDDPFYDGFYIPENVYIIGTMNDIDRSVESMDFAFRRRFTFKEITAADTQENILSGDSGLDTSIYDDAITRMNSLNAAIDNVEGLSSAYHIGGAYFLKLKELNNNFDLLWNYHLEGLLREYLRGMEDAENLLEDLHKAYNLESKDNQ